MKIQISFIVFTIMILCTDAISYQRKDQNLIETTCKRTPNYQLCTTTLRADSGSANADLPGLGLIMVGAIEAKTKEALSTIDKLTRGAQPKLLPSLKRCSEVYKTVLEGDVPVAKQTIRGNPKFAETAMADVKVEAQICDSALKGVVSPSLMAGLNKLVADLSDVARAVIRNLL